MTKTISITAMIATMLLTGGVLGAPELPDTWVNGGPYTREGLKGKLVVLYFYEEGCPRCRGAWPGILSAAKQYEGKPVLFVAVNSGNSPAEVQAYAREVNLDWPIIVDTSRSFETAIGLKPPISLNNIYQTRAIMPDGSVRTANIGRLDGELSKAKWRIDPSEVPTGFEDAWRAAEFGDYSNAIAQLRRARPRDDAGKAFKEKLESQISDAAKAQLESAKQAESSGKPWQAFRHYMTLSSTFTGHPEARDAATAARKLRSDATVRKELQAYEILHKIKQMVASPNLKLHTQGKEALPVLIEKFPDTEAASEAKGMIDGLKEQ